MTDGIKYVIARSEHEAWQRLLQAREMGGGYSNLLQADHAARLIGADWKVWEVIVKTTVSEVPFNGRSTTY